MTQPLGDGDRLRIRPICANDGPSMYAMFRRMSPPSRRYFWPHPFTPAVADSWAARASDPEYVIHVGEGDDERIHGYAWYHRASDDVPLVGIGLSDEGQGRGLGRRLLTSLIDEARQTRRRGVRLTVHKDNRRAQALYSRCGFRFSREDPTHHDYFMERRFAEESPAFAIRGMCTDGIPWHLTGLTADTWTIEEWKWYIRLLQAAGGNLLTIRIWPAQLHHRDDPWTHHNAWRYEVYREALGWARVWGLKTIVAFSHTAVPPHVWHTHPEERADKAMCQGVDLCWDRGRKTLLKYHQALLDHFGPVADGVVIGLLDPGSCRCPRCADSVRVVAEVLDTYRQMRGGRGEVHAGLWGGEWVDRGTQGRGAIPDLQRRVIESLPEGTSLWVPGDTEDELLSLAKSRGVNPLTMAFYQDPESGLEDTNILPRPRLVRTDQFIRSQRGQGMASLIGYRLTPFTQFPGDWVMMRKMVHPEADAADLLRDLGTYLFANAGTASPEGDATSFAEGVTRIEQWWEVGREFTPQRDCLLIEAIDAFERITWTYDSPMRALTDATRVLLELSRFRSGGGTDVDVLGRHIRDMMALMPIFQGFTHDQFEQTRARHFVRDRVRDWLEALH